MDLQALSDLLRRRWWIIGLLVRGWACRCFARNSFDAKELPRVGDAIGERSDRRRRRGTAPGRATLYPIAGELRPSAELGEDYGPDCGQHRQSARWIATPLKRQSAPLKGRARTPKFLAWSSTLRAVADQPTTTGIARPARLTSSAAWHQGGRRRLPRVRQRRRPPSPSAMWTSVPRGSLRWIAPVGDDTRTP